MKKVIRLIMSVLICGTLSVQAQNTKDSAIKASLKDTVKHWNVKGIFSLAFSQASFTNWAAGGQNSIGLTSLVSLKPNYTKGKFKWLNDIELGYGFQKLDAGVAQKTTDQIAVASNAGYNIFDSTLLGVLGSFQSQFQPGYQFPANDSGLLSRFMAPAYAVLGLGLTYAPHKWFSVFVSPITAKLTFVEDQHLADAGAYGVQPAVYDASGSKIQNGKNELTQVGAYLKANFSKEVVKNMTITTTVELFSNYLKNPQNIVVNWATFIQCKVNKVISVTLNTQLIYDDNIALPIYKVENGVNTLVGKGPRVQFKDILGVGLAYNL